MQFLGVTAYSKMKPESNPILGRGELVCYLPNVGPLPEEVTCERSKGRTPCSECKSDILNN